jgi:hypothetical protein
MKIPTMHGVIDRRILINFKVDNSVMENFLPKPFRAKLVDNKAIVGICLIRLKNIRPKGLPEFIGVSSENGAHRIAVEWEEEGRTKEGVYIPRRDSSSKLNALVGGRIFPGVHHHAKFTVEEKDKNYSVEFISDDRTSLSIKATETNEWNKNSVFSDLDGASSFFQKGAIGYSPDNTGKHFDGLELNTYKWEISPLAVSYVKSSFFENEKIFPKGSVEFDNALLMRNIEHEWKSLQSL